MAAFVTFVYLDGLDCSGVVVVYIDCSLIAQFVGFLRGLGKGSFLWVFGSFCDLERGLVYGTVSVCIELCIN